MSLPPPPPASSPAQPPAADSDDTRPRIDLEATQILRRAAPPPAVAPDPERTVIVPPRRTAADDDESVDGFAPTRQDDAPLGFAPTRQGWVPEPSGGGLGDSVFGDAEEATRLVSSSATVMTHGTTPMVRSAATLPGGDLDDQAPVQQVGRYRVLERLGRGGMASVFRAHDPSIGRDVALKFLHASLSADPVCRMRFLQEARAAGALSHPNIAVVHDVGEIEGRPYMAMELLSGVTLSSELEEKRMLPVRDAVTVAMQLARALDHAHRHGIVHRDIKPGNIMRDLQGAVKVTDFGIAHVEDTSREMQTRHGDVIGTPQYMSPEQARGEKLDGRSDLFSVGIVLYQMLTGTRPFRGEGLAAITHKIVNEEPPPLDRARKDIPPSLRRVVDRCLAKSPAQRYGTGRELLEALSKVRDEIDEAAREASRPRIVSLRVKWAAAMALVVALVMGATASVIVHRQNAALLAQTTGNGASLAHFIAAQNAAAVLGEDWVAVDIALQEVMKSGAFERLAVVDLGGVVRASSVSESVGHVHLPPLGERLASPGREVVVTRMDVAAQPVLAFEAPITFQGKKVGQVVLGLSEQPLTQVRQLSLTLMAALVLITTGAAALAVVALAQRFGAPVKLLSESMAEIARGRLGHRIGETRNDEFGLLYADFDAMAQALQDRQAAGGAGGGDTPTSFNARRTP
ncbi:MAG: protein kinase domain-containing protein [Rubrivivax sp.]